MTEKLAVSIIMDILNDVPVEDELYYEKDEWEVKFKEVNIKK